MNRWIRHPAAAIALVVFLGLTACSASSTGSPLATMGVTPTPLASAEATPLPTATPTPAPEPAVSSNATFSLLPTQAPAGFEVAIRCDGPIGPSDPVAIVELVGPPDALTTAVMRDYADPANPRTVCVIDVRDVRVVQLIDARHIMVDACPSEGPCVSAVVDLPQVAYHWFKLPQEPDTYSEFVAVSPGLDEVAWISSLGDGTGRRLHLTRATGDSVVADLLPVGGRCGTPDDSKHGAYTHSGESLYVLDVPIAQDTVFLAITGGQEAMSLRPPAGGWTYSSAPIMPVWSPTDETLYYSQAGNVWRWTASGGAEVFMEDVHWRYPTITPDGRYLAYAAIRDDGLHDVYLVDLAAGSDPKLIGRGRTLPAFLNDSQLWYKSEAQGVCGPGTDQPLIYNVTDGSESPSIIQSVNAVWPATSSNF
jgi:hypothetical protein